MAAVDANPLFMVPSGIALHVSCRVVLLSIKPMPTSPLFYSQVSEMKVASEKTVPVSEISSSPTLSFNVSPSLGLYCSSC